MRPRKNLHAFPACAAKSCGDAAHSDSLPSRMRRKSARAALPFLRISFCMNTLTCSARSFIFSLALGGIGFALALPAWSAESNSASPSASELAGRLSALRQDGASLIRVRLENKPATAAAGTAQLQIKSVRTKQGSEALIQVLWPKERKGEGILIVQHDGGAPSTTVFTPPDKLEKLPENKGLFGGALTPEDLITNFYAWKEQSIAGNESVNGVNCIVLDSKAGKSDSSSYSHVKSWIDAKRLVPMRVEKFSTSGQMACRIETTRVAEDDQEHPIPATFVVTRPGLQVVTELQGSSTRHGVSYSGSDFTTEALKNLGSAH